MRVIAGLFRSRKLKGPGKLKLRPTSDRLRETLFNILGAQVVHSYFVDLYAGTGAVGIEALSRGARRVVFVENQREAASLIKENLRSLGVSVGAEVLEMDAERAVIALARKEERANLVFLDPPYAAKNSLLRVLDAIHTAGLVQFGGFLVVEERKRTPIELQCGEFKKIRSLVQGDSGLSIWQRLPE